MRPNADAMLAALKSGFPTATDLADYMTRELRMPFREAHKSSGAIVADAETKGIDITDLSLSELQAIEPRIKSEISHLFTVENSVASRTSYGGTAPDEVRTQIIDAKKRFGLE